jgi:tetratricopeptide (TPR) repeat protein
VAKPGDLTDLLALKSDPLAGLDLPTPKSGELADLPTAKDDPFAGLDLPGPRGDGGGIALGSSLAPGPAPDSADAAFGPAGTTPSASGTELSLDALPGDAGAGDRRGGLAYGELDLGEGSSDSVLHHDDPPRTAVLGGAAAAGDELDLDLERHRPSLPATAAVPQKAGAPAAPARRRSAPLPLLALVLLVAALAAVPFALGHGPFFTKLFLGDEDTGGEAPTSVAADVVAVKTVAPDAAAALAPRDTTNWGDLPPVDVRFLENPEAHTEGIEPEGYVASGMALLRMQDPYFLTLERFHRLCAIPALTRLIQMKPRAALGALRTLAGQAFDRALERRPGDVDAMMGQGRVSLLAGDVPAALGAFENAASHAPGSADPLFGQVEALFSHRVSDRFARAERILMELDGLAAGDVRLPLFWGDVHAGFGSPGEAEARYLQALEQVRAAATTPSSCEGDACETAPADAPAAPAIDPRWLLAAYERAVVFYVGVAEAKWAGRMPRSSLEFPDEPEALLARAREIREEGRARLADSLPLEAAVGVALARCGLAARRPEVLAEAREMLEAARDRSGRLLVAPLDPLFYLGLIYRQNREKERAVEVFDQIASQDDTYPGVFMMLVQLSHSPQLLAEKLDDHLALLEARPDDPDVLLRVAVSAYYAAKPDIARGALERILAANPDAPDANHYLGRMLLEEGKTAEARTYLLRAVEKTVTPISSYYLLLGRLYEIEGNVAGAIQNYKTARTLDDESWEAPWRLGEIYFRLGVQDAETGDTPESLFLAAETNAPESASVQASLARFVETFGGLERRPEAAERYARAIALNETSGELAPIEVGAAHASLGKMLEETETAEAEQHYRTALRIGVQLEDELRRRPDSRPDALLTTVRWYWEAAYRYAQLLRDRGDTPTAATYFEWVLPYVVDQPEEANARRALAVIRQIVPADRIVSPADARALPELP